MDKFSQSNSGYSSSVVNKAILTMKLTFLLVLLGCFQVSAKVNGQDHMTLKLNNVSIEKVLKKIQKKTPYRFFYNQRSIEDLSKVSVDVDGASLDRVMNMILGDYLGYKLVDKDLVVISPKSQLDLPDRTLTGKVTGPNGEALIGVTIKIKNTDTGTVTDASGNYSLEVPDNAILEVSFIGYASQEIQVGSDNKLDIQMESSASGLNEVVVVGYGTQKKVNLTGAIETVDSKVFENRSTPNVSQALQGAVPNLNLFLEDGKPTRSPSFNVRGMTSIGQGGSALVLIDGVEGDPSLLNPNDIESVTVLKDEASAAVYGARGAFGVVLITTKSAESGKTKINYTGNFSSNSLAMKPKFVTDGTTWLEHFRMAFNNESGNVPTSINNNMQFYSDGWLDRMRDWQASGEGPKTEVRPNGDYEYYTNTDWMAELFKDNTLSLDHNLSLSGGSDKAKFYVSGRYYKFDGIYRYNPDVYQSRNIRTKTSLQAFDWLNLSANIEYGNNTYHNPYTANARSANVIRYIQVSAPPTMPLYNPDGSFTRGGAYTLAGFIDGNNYEDTKENLFRSTFGFNSSFWDDKVRVVGDFTFRYNTNEHFWKRTKEPYFQNADAEEPSYVGDLNGIADEGSGHTMYTASNVYAEYENLFNEVHHVKVMGGWNYETSNLKSNSLQRNQLLLEDASSIQMATGTSMSPSASVINWRTAGVFYRVNYDYLGRYLVEVNGRYDGSTRFPNEQQWGFFPSFSLGWRLSEEPFFNLDKDVFSNIKVRASYGSLGNGNLSPYQFLELLSIATSGRVLDGSLGAKTSAPAPIPSGLTWEKATTSDVGLDMEAFKGRISFVGDYYVRKTRDMYVVGPELPDIFGASSPKGNFASMTTRGFELTLKWQDQFDIGGKPFNYNIGASLYDYVSTIDNFNNPTNRITQYYDGMKIGEIWGFETDGLFQENPTPDEYINTLFKSSSDGKWRAGDVRIKNLDGSSDNMITKGEQTVEDPGDMAIIGNSEPRYQYSINLGAEWNGIFFSARLHGVGQQDWYPGQENAFWGQYNRGYNQMPSFHLNNYWTEDHTDAYLPRYSQYNGAAGWSGEPNDRYLQNVSYLRLQNVQIGYSLPRGLISKLNLENARIYISGENLMSWSPVYKVTDRFMDVMSLTGDSDSDLNSGYNQGGGNVYPLLKSISIGISLTY